MNWRRWVAGAAIGLVPSATAAGAFRKEGLNSDLLGAEHPHTHVEIERPDGTVWGWSVRNSTFSGALAQVYAWKWSSGTTPRP